MALDVATGTFNIGTGGIGTLVSVTGLPFQPQVVIFIMGGRTAVGQAEATHRLGMSYMVSAADRAGTAHRSVHNSASTDTQSVYYEDAAIATVNISGGIPFEDGMADFDAWLPDGFRLIIDSPFDADYLIHFLALAGLTNVAGLRVPIPNPGVAPGTIQDFNIIGFTPDSALSFGVGGDGIIAALGSSFQLGVVAGGHGDGRSGDDPVNAILVGEDIGGDATSITGSYCRRGEFIADVSAFGGFGYTRAKLVKWLSNGFRLQWIESSTPTTNVYFRVLCFKGAQFDVGFGQTMNATNGLKRFVEDVPFKPKALILGSNNKIESPDASTIAPNPSSRIPFNAEISIGFATATAQNVVGVIDQDAQATTNVAIDQRTDAFYVNQSNDAAIVEEGRASLTSFDDDPGFTLTQDDADPAQSFFWFLAIGAAVVAGPAGTFGFNDTVPHSMLQEFAPPAEPWTPLWWGGPTTILFDTIPVARRATMPVSWGGFIRRETDLNQKYLNLLVYDSFFVEVTTNLDNHGPDIGVNWTKLSTGSALLRCNFASGRLQNLGGGHVRYIAAPQPSDDQRVEANVDATTVVGFPTGLLIRCVSNTTGYVALIEPDGTFTIRRADGVSTSSWVVLASTVVPFVIGLQPMTLEARGNVITATYGGATLEVVDSTHASGFAGVAGFPPPAGNICEWDSLYIYSIVPFGLAIDWQGVLPRRGEMPVDWSGSISRRATIPVEWAGSVARRAEIPAEWSGFVARRAALPVEWSGFVTRRATLPVEWAGFVSRRATLPVEWQGQIARRAEIPVEWQGVVARRAQLPVEWSGELQRRATIPVEWGGVITRRTEIPVEWTGQVQVGITRRSELPVEWTAPEVVGGGAFLAGGGAPWPPVWLIPGAEEAFISEAELRFGGETIARWMPVPEAPATITRSPRRRRVPVIPVVQAEPVADHLRVSAVGYGMSGHTLVRWEPWVGVQEADDEAALIFALMLR